MVSGGWWVVGGGWQALIPKALTLTRALTHRGLLNHGCEDDRLPMQMHALHMHALHMHALHLHALHLHALHLPATCMPYTCPLHACPTPARYMHARTEGCSITTVRMLDAARK